MSKPLLTGLLAFGLFACSASGSKDLDSTVGVASTTAVIPDTTPRTLAVGTTVQATIQDSVSSQRNTTGQHVNAIVSRHVMDDGGHIVIPGGAALVLTIAKLGPAKSPGAADGVIALRVTSLTVSGTTYEPTASVAAVPHNMQGRGVIVTPGTPITITLTQPLKIAAN